MQLRLPRHPSNSGVQKLRSPHSCFEGIPDTRRGLAVVGNKEPGDLKWLDPGGPDRCREQDSEKQTQIEREPVRHTILGASKDRIISGHLEKVRLECAIGFGAEIRGSARRAEWATRVVAPNTLRVPKRWAHAAEGRNRAAPENRGSVLTDPFQAP